MDTNQSIAIGIFILLAAGGTVYTINAPRGYDAYSCEANNVIGLCWKLSAVNDEGIQRNCYWNQSAPRRYKVCTSGWELYTMENVTGKEVPEYYYERVSQVLVEKLNFTEYEAYDYNLSDGTFQRCLKGDKINTCQILRNKSKLDEWEENRIDLIINATEERESITKELISVKKVEITK